MRRNGQRIHCADVLVPGPKTRPLLGAADDDVGVHQAHLHQGVPVKDHPAGDAGIFTGSARVQGGYPAAEAIQHAVGDVRPFVRTSYFAQVEAASSGRPVLSKKTCPFAMG